MTTFLHPTWLFLFYRRCVIQVWVPLQTPVLGDLQFVGVHWFIGFGWLQLWAVTWEQLQQVLEITQELLLLEGRDTTQFAQMMHIWYVFSERNKLIKLDECEFTFMWTGCVCHNTHITSYSSKCCWMLWLLWGLTLELCCSSAAHFHCGRGGHTTLSMAPQPFLAYSGFPEQAAFS